MAGRQGGGGGEEGGGGGRFDEIDEHLREMDHVVVKERDTAEVSRLSTVMVND